MSKELIVYLHIPDSKILGKIEKVDLSFLIQSALKWMWTKLWEQIVSIESITPSSIDVKLVLSIIEDPKFYLSIRSPDNQYFEITTYIRLLKIGLGIHLMGLIPLDVIKECIASYEMVCYEYCSELLPLSKRHVDYCFMHCNKVLGDKIYKLWVDKMAPFFEWNKFAKDKKTIFLFPHEFLMLTCNCKALHSVFKRYYEEKKTTHDNFSQLPVLTLDKLLNQNIDNYAQKVFDKDFVVYNKYTFFGLSELMERHKQEEISKQEDKNLSKISLKSQQKRKPEDLPKEIKVQLEDFKKAKLRENIDAHLNYNKMMRLMSNGICITSTNRKNETNRDRSIYY